jgi:hypothetical protein
MAFLIPIEVMETGVTAAYWRITHVQLDRAAGIVETVLHGFRDEEARHDGKAPLQRLSYRLRLDAMENPSSLDLARLYDAVRREPAGEDEPPVFAAAADA